MKYLKSSIYRQLRVTTLGCALLSSQAIADTVISNVVEPEVSLGLTETESLLGQKKSDLTPKLIQRLLRIDSQIIFRIISSQEFNHLVKDEYQAFIGEKRIFDVKLYIFWKQGRSHHIKLESKGLPLTHLQQGDWPNNDKCISAQIISNFEFLEFILNSETEGYYLGEDLSLLPAIRHNIITPMNNLQITTIMQDLSRIEMKSLDFRIHDDSLHTFITEDKKPHPLPHLTTNEIDSGRYIKVINESDKDPFNSGDTIFEADLEEHEKSLVYSYKNLTSSKEWFLSFYTPASINEEIHVYPGQTSKENINNAFFIPKTQSPSGVTEIHMGLGDGKLMKNISFDPEVAMHEYSHSIIYQHLKSAKGQSGIIHEGTADFLTATRFQNPHIGSQIVINKDYLRTTALPSHMKYDDLNSLVGKYSRSQYWSSFLWDLEKKIGTSRSQMLVIGMLPYLTEKSGIEDAIIGLVEADLSVADPLSVSDSTSYCHILISASNRGFGAYLSRLKNKECDINLKKIVQNSSSKLNQLAENNTTNNGEENELLNSFCGTISSKKNQNKFYIFLLLFLPLSLRSAERRLNGFF